MRTITQALHANREYQMVLGDELTKIEVMLQRNSERKRVCVIGERICDCVHDMLCLITHQLDSLLSGQTEFGHSFYFVVS
jgi:hypothetical protein